MEEQKIELPFLIDLVQTIIVRNPNVKDRNTLFDIVISELLIRLPLNRPLPSPLSQIYTTELRISAYRELMKTNGGFDELKRRILKVIDSLLGPDGSDNSRSIEQ
jgi:hypothetical protein